MEEKQSLPKNRRVTLEDSYKKNTRRKGKETLEEEKNNHDFSQRERETWNLRESSSTLRLREPLTSTLVSREENQRTARTATCYLHK